MSSSAGEIEETKGQSPRSYPGLEARPDRPEGPGEGPRESLPAPRPAQGQDRDRRDEDQVRAEDGDWDLHGHSDQRDLLT